MTSLEQTSPAAAITPDGEILSTAMVAALSSFAVDAASRVNEPGCAGLFERWRATFGEHMTHDEARDTFAGEASFAAAARLVLDARIGGLAGRRVAFPHLYASELFSWYEPGDDLRNAVREALSLGLAEEPIEMLGWLYQFSIPESVRKRFGQFYTGPAVVFSMLDNLGFKGAAALSGRLIDPACGAGAFLIEATRRVLAAAEQDGLSDGEACAAVQRAIHGLDINPLGVLLTEAAIALLLAPRLARLPESAELAPLHLYVTDTLRAGELSGEEHADVASAIKARHGEFASGFDFVVANPPYAKFPSRLMDAEQKRRFAATTSGHPNLYGLFLQVGVELLADGGRLSFINPKSFVSGAYFRNLRRFLTEHLDIKGFDLFDKRTGLFHGVLQEVIILTGTRSSAQREFIELREFAGAPDCPPARAIEVASSSVLLGETFDYAFFTAVDPLTHRVLARMTERSRPLSAFGMKAVTGTIVWNRLKPHVRHGASDDALPLVWGNGIRMFRFAGIGNRAGEGTHMALVDKTRKIIAYGDALLVKRMTAREEARRLVACRVPARLANSPAGYFGENHVNIIRPLANARLDLDAVLGLLNSDLFDYIFRALNGNTNVSATELELMPVVQGPELEEVASAARRLTAAGGVDGEALADLNDAVYRLYRLDEDDVRAMSAGDVLALAS